VPHPFSSTQSDLPHPNLGEQVNSNIIRSEIEGGVYLCKLEIDSRLEIETRNRRYVLVNRGDGDALLSGHPEFCPEPVLVKIHGSNWGGSMLKADFVGRGMHMEFSHPAYKGSIVTSPVVEIREL